MVCKVPDEHDRGWLAVDPLHTTYLHLSLVPGPFCKVGIRALAASESPLQIPKIHVCLQYRRIDIVCTTVSASQA